MLSSILLFFPMHLHPLFYATCALICGIWWQSIGNALIVPIITGLCITTLLALQKKKPTYYLLLIAIISASFLAGYKRHQHLHNIYNNFYTHFANKSLDIICTIDAIETNNKARFKNQITITIKKIKKQGTQSWQQCNKKIYLYATKKNNMRVGDTIALGNIILKSISNSSFKDYLIKENIYATIFMTTCNPTHIKRPTYSLKRWVFEYKEAVLKKLQTILSPQTYKLVSSIFLGNPTTKKYMDEEKMYLKMWGIVHYLARSGLHLILFILVWQTIMQCIPLPFKLKQIIILTIATIYFGLTWQSLSFNRAFATFILYKTYSFFTIQSHLLHCLTLICFITLLYNPMHLFFLDFQLSFGLTCALAWLSQLQLQNKRFYNKNY